MPNLPAEKSDKAETAQTTSRRSLLRWTLVPTAFFGFIGIWHLWNVPFLFVEDLPRSGSVFSIVGVSWLYCARCWWAGRIKRALCLVFLGSVLSNTVVTAPASEKEFLRDPVKADLR